MSVTVALGSRLFEDDGLLVNVTETIVATG